MSKSRSLPNSARSLDENSIYSGVGHTYMTRKSKKHQSTYNAALDLILGIHQCLDAL